MPITKVEGPKKSHKVFLYTLSTCGWCKRTKEMLREEGVDYAYLDLDAVVGEERERALEDIKRLNARMGFPLIIVDDSIMINGYDPPRIKEALGI